MSSREASEPPAETWTFSRRGLASPASSGLWTLSAATTRPSSSTACRHRLVAWLKTRRRAPWQPAIGVGDLAPAVEEGPRQLWPRTSVFWGAILDETDRRELTLTRQIH